MISLNVKSLTIKYCNNQYLIDNLPNSIKKLTIYYHKEKLNNLPNSIKYLELNDYNLKIKKIPKNLETIKCYNNYEYIDDFKNYEVIYYNDVWFL